MSILQRCLKKRELERPIQNRGANPARQVFLIVDAQSVKNTGSVQGKGYDAEKKICRITVSILQLMHKYCHHALAITAANVTDRSGALLAFEHNKENLTEVKGVLCDGGYSGKPFADAVKSLLGEQVDVQVIKRNELHTFTVILKRRVAERSLV